MVDESRSKAARERKRRLEKEAVIPPKRTAPQLDIPHADEFKSSVPIAPPPFIQPPPFLESTSTSLTVVRPTPPRPKKKLTTKQKAIGLGTILVLTVVATIGIRFLTAKPNYTVDLPGGAQIIVPNKGVSPLERWMNRPSDWTDAQEAVRQYTGLPYDQILKPYSFNRVLLWRGDKGDRFFSLRTMQDALPEYWRQPEGNGVFVIAIHGDPKSPLPTVKRGYFVDGNNKIRGLAIEEGYILIDGMRIENDGFPSFR